MIVIGCIEVSRIVDTEKFNSLYPLLYNQMLNESCLKKKIFLKKIVTKYLLDKIFKKIGLNNSILSKVSLNEYGKPIILDSSIYFNVSHSHNKIVAIVSNEGDVGIDIEKIRPLSLNGFEYFFYENEWNGILNSENQSKALLNNWTIKEASLKCVGTGFSNLNQDVKILDDKAIVIRNGTKTFCNYKTIYLDEEYVVTCASLKEFNSPISINYF